MAPSDKLWEMQYEQAIPFYRKRAGAVKRCEFRRFKEWARDYIQEHDKNQMDFLCRQLGKHRQEDEKGKQRMKS
jgi:hypothetical protein